MMLLPQVLVTALLLAPALVSAAIFPKNGPVKMLNSAGFRKAMKENRTSVVAFVAPWCGHCQKLVPEYVKAATALAPLIDVYAVDCDEEENKPLCGQQGIKGFPTVKLFKRGKALPGQEYQGERTAIGIVKHAQSSVPNLAKRLTLFEDVLEWSSKTGKPRALLLSKDKNVPLLWQVLSNEFKGQLELGVHADPWTLAALQLGVPKPEKGKAIVLVFAPDATMPLLFDGKLKYEALSKVFGAVAKGDWDAADLKALVKEAESGTAAASTDDAGAEDRKKDEL